ncbi:MAG TPA: histidine kinase [Actinomycetes bacterium]|nr:histidine kinase [Actinomycetes bacterium]
MQELFEAVATLATTRTSSKVLDEMVRLAGTLTHAGSVTLSLPDSDKGQRDIIAWHSKRASRARSKDRPPPERIVLPVELAHHVAGLLEVSDPADGSFGEHDELAARVLVAAAALALDNARAFEQGAHHRRRLEAMAEVQDALLTTFDSRQVLSLVADRARDVVGADVAAIVVPLTETDLIVDVVAGTAGEQALGRRIARAGSLCGEVMATGRARVVDPSKDACVFATVWPWQQHAGAILVPLRTAAGVAGVLLVINTVDRQASFDLNQAATLGAFAGQAALAIERTQARDDRLRLSLYEDRERIARDLHDHVIQRLFATGLTLQRFGGRHDTGPLDDMLQTVVDEIDTTIAQIREVIHQLHEHPDEATFVASLRRVISDAEGVLGFAPALEPGARPDQVPQHLRADVLAVLREALSNAARHAHAHAVHVALDVGDRLRLAVDDDGDGLGESSRRSGLLNLRRRAEAHGGHLRIDTGATGRGTRLVWDVPTRP